MRLQMHVIGKCNIFQLKVLPLNSLGMALSHMYSSLLFLSSPPLLPYLPVFGILSARFGCGWDGLLGL